MSITRGCFGKVKAKVAGASGAAVAVGELSDWSFEESAEQIDSSSMGSCTKAFTAGAKQTTGSLTVHWDNADAAQALFVVGDRLHLEVYPGGSGSGQAYYKTTDTATGGAVINSISRAGNGVDGIAGSVFGFAVNGELTATSVP